MRQNNSQNHVDDQPRVGRFGESWGLVGRPNYSEVTAVVGGIDEGNMDDVIGLSAMQMDNLGCDYGPCQINISNDIVPVSAYNAMGHLHLDGAKIRISEGIALRLGLSEGDELIIERYSDEHGKIKYLCRNQPKNPFGQGWGKIPIPAEAIIAAIDSDGYNTELYRVGLSAMQMYNLGIERCSEPLDSKSLVRVIAQSKAGVLDGQDFGDILVEFAGKKVPAQVYNAFGTRSIGGCGIRVSSILAEDLGLELEDRILLYKKGK